MIALRRRLRQWAALWLVLQTASLAAFVPRDCCKAHRPDPHDLPACHKNTAATHSDQSQNPTCSMRATCQGPMAVLAAFLPTHGIIPDQIVVRPELQGRAIAITNRERLIRRLVSPDTPPPRS
jgi:hypothetical protein